MESNVAFFFSILLKCSTFIDFSLMVKSG